MARSCRISGKIRLKGNRVSHANNKTGHDFKINVLKKRLFVPELQKFVRVQVSTAMLRTIDKLGFTGALKKHGLTLKDVQ